VLNKPVEKKFFDCSGSESADVKNKLMEGRELSLLSNFILDLHEVIFPWIQKIYFRFSDIGFVNEVCSEKRGICSTKMFE